MLQSMGTLSPLTYTTNLNTMSNTAPALPATKPLNLVNTLSDTDDMEGIPVVFVKLTHIDGTSWVEQMCADTHNEYSRHPEVASLQVL
jgi:hypothetical protein